MLIGSCEISGSHEVAWAERGVFDINPKNATGFHWSILPKYTLTLVAVYKMYHVRKAIDDKRFILKRCFSLSFRAYKTMKM
jgi:hypothetical protein